MRAGIPPLVERADGWVQFTGEQRWQVAQFSVAPPSTGLTVACGDVPPTTIDLRRVTALDELLGGPRGYQQVEIAVDRRPLAQAVWAPEFTGRVLAALEATIEPVAEHDVEGERELVPASARRRAGAGMIGALALVGCGALIVGALGLRNDDSGPPAETAVLTQTTLRGPATTTTSTPVDPAGEACAEPEATTTVPAVGCEPG